MFIPSINQNGTVLSLPSKSGEVQIQVGAIKMFFNVSELSAVSAETSKPNQSNTPNHRMGRRHSSSPRHEFNTKSIPSEINVIGQTVTEACSVIDKYLDNCSLSSLKSVRIIHGKGTGALKNGIHKFLKTHPHVEDFRIGTFGEGELGVTIVNLK